MSTLDLHSVAMRVVQALEELKIRYQVGGSLASSAMGVPRASLDADLVADIREEHAENLIARLGSDFYTSWNGSGSATRSRSDSGRTWLVLSKCREIGWTASTRRSGQSSQMSRTCCSVPSKKECHEL